MVVGGQGIVRRCAQVVTADTAQRSAHHFHFGPCPVLILWTRRFGCSGFHHSAFWQSRVRLSGEKRRENVQESRLEEIPLLCLSGVVISFVGS